MIAVLVLGFGGPECLEEVGPFVERVTGRELPPERLAASVEKYRIIGGGSPLCGISRKQAALLESALRRSGQEAKVFLGMRHWNPGIDVAVEEAIENNPARLIAICLTPYFSRMSAGDYLTKASEALKIAKPEAILETINEWNEEPALIAAFAENLRDCLAHAGEGARVVFTAHSLPKSMIDAGDPYADQISETIQLTAAAAGLDSWVLGWQSEGHGRGEWLKPTVEECLAETKKSSAKSVIVAPIGFISDHVETLYDLDIILKRQAGDLGLKYFRTTGLNENEKLAEAMASAVKKELNDGGSWA
jgi:protoporphyrin/coproporphyrin ferrochelatase